jgi:predicted ATP-binding protein involved in virulence
MSDLSSIQKTLNDIKRQQDDINRKIDSQQRDIERIGKDIGHQDNKNLADTVYRIDNNLSRDLEGLRTMIREVQDIRRTTTNLEVTLKEVMRGMSIIYNSVDELEDNLLPERLTR